MREKLVGYSVAGNVARLTLDSPHNRNALSTALVDQLHRALREAAAEKAVRAVVLTHTGGTFCAGADLAEAAGRAPSDVAYDRARELTEILQTILRLPVPVIGAVNGHVRAGGMGLIAACDIAVAGPKSTFALTEAQIGVAPSIISLTLLPKLTARAAGRYFLTGEKFGPAVAAQIGLITVEAQDVDAALSDLTARLSTASPQGLAATKALTTAPILDAFDQRAEELTAQSVRLFGSEEAREGMLAFLEKRPPRWSGG